jgi:hypothetical protein
VANPALIGEDEDEVGFEGISVSPHTVLQLSMHDLHSREERGKAIQ